MAKSKDQAAGIDATRQSVETQLRMVLYSALVVEPEKYSFREEEELTGLSIRSLADEIAASLGMTTPVLARDLGGGKNLLLDGHRRFLALGDLIERGVRGFTRDMPIPANMVVSEAPERELLARTLSANFHRSPIGALGRIKAAVSLTRSGMPKQEVARILGIGTSTLDRDLLLGTTEWIMDHIRRHHIAPTTASALLEAARKAKRVEEFRDELEGWIADTKARLREENRKRQARDQDLLAGPDLWPQKQMSRQQVENWAESLRTQQPFGKPAFKFKALITRQKGKERVEIDGLSMDLKDLSAEDLGKILVRFTDMGDQLIPVIHDKPRKEGEGDDQPESSGRGLDRLRQLGFHDLADRLDAIERERQRPDGNPDPDFDQTSERVEQDVSSTVELPEDVADRDAGEGDGEAEE